MAYKTGVALGASVTLLIGSIALLALYVACSALECKALPSSYGSPIWAGVLILTTAFVGIFMSTTKSEKGCGVLFLILSVIGVFVTLACMGLTLYTSFLELLSPLSSSSVYRSFTTTAATTPTSLDPVTGFILWIIMMTVAFILSIVTCVTSCQYCCCCQREPVHQQTFVVVQGGTNLPQHVHVENTTILPQAQLPGQMVYLANAPSPNPPFVQQPYPGQQLFSYQTTPPQLLGVQPPPYAATASYSNSSQNVTLPMPQSHQPGPSVIPTAPPNVTPTAPPIPHDTQVHPQPPRSATGVHQPHNRPVTPTLSSNVTSDSDYQPLIIDAHQTSSSSHRSDNEQPQATSPKDVNVGLHSDIEHTYAQATGGSTTDNGGYLHPNQPRTVTTSDLNSRLYEYIEDPSYDYVNPEETPKDLFAGETNTEYVNDNIGKRPKAPTPSK